MNARLEYNHFVTQADRLLSNWTRADRAITVDIFEAGTRGIIESTTGMSTHNTSTAPDDDPIWLLLQKYFGSADAAGEHVVFVRPGDDGDAPDSYEPVGRRAGIVVQIENEELGEVAYMRVPEELKVEHRPHQFSQEYTNAMLVLQAQNWPHAWVDFHDGLAGHTYQILDPDGGLWDEVIEAQGQKNVSRLRFKYHPIDKRVVPILVPGYPRSRDFEGDSSTELTIDDLVLKNSEADNVGPSKIIGVIRAATKGIDVDGFEIWAPAYHFNDDEERPTRITNLEEWQKFLGSQVLPTNQAFGLVVRPVYNTYILRRSDNENVKNDCDVNKFTLNAFRGFVRSQLYNDYDGRNDVIVLDPINQQSFQADFAIRPETTDAEWKWIRRNITEPNLKVSLERWDNAWRKYIHDLCLQP
jgi:hypothetical protein